MRFNLEWHLKIIKNNIINMPDYEMYLYCYLQSVVTRDQNLINELKNVGTYNKMHFHKKIQFMLDKKLVR